ncbi:MAG: heme d1 biosynthesis radical SAM protein NirJ [Rhodocyclaceae bacterium]|nr:heme d1 biosynthesis radical SAM protein NirJ [Rhodocyclaceae bacterium]
MFRISRYIRTLAGPATTSERRPEAPAGRGPVVIWNLIRRCNLTCRHCYSISADKDFAGELATDEVFRVMDDLAAFDVPVLILSGGEPLLRPDIFEIAGRAKRMGFYVGLSTNGTLIDAAMADRIGTLDLDYVGISLDGLRATHDRFRRMDGAFDKSLAGLRLARNLGLKVGLRFTLTRDNATDLPALLQLVEDEAVDRFYLSHLNYAGRGNKNRSDDAQHRMTREAMTLLFERVLAMESQGVRKDFTTGNNDADGVFFLHWVARRLPAQLEQARRMLTRWGGNASGVGVANIDNLGNVHPDTMWWHHTLGNVRERAFSAIWQDRSHGLMAGLAQRPRPVTGRCGACAYLAICNGSSRVRAEQVTGDPWQEDPGCYLDDGEIGIAEGRARVAVTPWRRVVPLKAEQS